MLAKLLIDEKNFIKSKFFKVYLLTKKACEIVNKKHEKTVRKHFT
ncbi:hypothetical protein GCM10022396_04820 [Flavivirga amylovorans]